MRIAAGTMRAMYAPRSARGRLDAGPVISRINTRPPGRSTRWHSSNTPRRSAKCRKAKPIVSASKDCERIGIASAAPCTFAFCVRPEWSMPMLASTPTIALPFGGQSAEGGGQEVQHAMALFEHAAQVGEVPQGEADRERVVGLRANRNRFGRALHFRVLCSSGVEHAKRE